MPSSFRPVRASPSPPPRASSSRTHPKLTNISHFDVTSSTETSSTSAALSSLTAEDVAIIDEIVQRASSATAFLGVFKAYNEVLQERGMDSGDDVIYYRILLKLGVVKGHDWGTKWATAKSQYGYGGSSVGGLAQGRQNRQDIPRSSATPKSSSIHKPIFTPTLRTPLSQRLQREPTKPLALDSITVHSHEETADLTDDSSSDTTTTSDSPKTLSQTDNPRNLNPRRYDPKLKPSIFPTKIPPLPSIEQFLPVSATHSSPGHRLDDELSSTTASDEDSTVSYEAGHAPEPVKSLSVQKPPPTVLLRGLQPTRPVVQQQQTIPNDDDTWSKVKMIRDEKEADRFREIMLMERCFQIWRDALRWTQTTGEKASRLNERIMLRATLAKWHLHLMTRKESFQQVEIMADSRLLRRIFLVWQKRHKLKGVAIWRNEMRRKMNAVKEKRQISSMSQFWKSWRKAFELRRAEDALALKSCKNFLNRWKLRMVKVDQLESMADRFIATRESHKVLDCWDSWRKLTMLCDLQRAAAHRIGKRLQEEAWVTWKQRMAQIKNADFFHDKIVMKSAFIKMKEAKARMQALTTKAEKYHNRQESVLVHAVMRVWMARERGLLLDRVVKTRLLQTVFESWKRRMRELATANDRAKNFTVQSSSSTLLNAYRRWVENFEEQQRQAALATQFYQSRLQHRTLTHCRILLRTKLKMAKQAKVARKYLLMRLVWDSWRKKLEDKRRQKKLHLTQEKLLASYFTRWRVAATKQQYHRFALNQVQTMISMRLERRVLDIWTNKVIALKTRELDTSEQRSATNLKICLEKWKAAYKRQKDLLHLQQSYSIVKREETLRRSFHRWLATAKSSRHRRVMLQEREEELKLAIIEEAWEKWREKLQAERLKPLEHVLQLQLQKSRLYHAFIVWHSKTKSTPAIRFDALRSKVKFWRIWRDAMPKALQAKKAREKDQKKLLANALDKWAQAYRTKIALKAVARARYLRLPSGLPRQSLPLSSALSGILRSSPSRSEVTKRPTLSTAGDTSDVEEKSSEVRLGRFSRKPRSLRSGSPAPTIHTQAFSEADAKPSNNLWMEMRRMRSRPPSEPR